MVKSGLQKYFWNFSMRSPFSIKWIYLIKWRSFGQTYKFSNENDRVRAWRKFENIFSRPLFTIIFRLEMLKFHQYSILTVDTMVGFVIIYVLKLFFQSLLDNFDEKKANLKEFKEATLSWLWTHCVCQMQRTTIKNARIPSTRLQTN